MDKNLKRYYNIKKGVGRPEIIDTMYDFARPRGSMRDAVEQEVFACADRISRVWKEEQVREMIFGLSLDLMSLQESLERNGLEAHVDLSGCFCKACRKADEEAKQKSEEAMNKLSELDQELGLE